MPQHDDLLEAALNAVNAIENHSETKNANVQSDVSVAEQKKRELEQAINAALIPEPLDPENDFSIDLSLSSLGKEDSSLGIGDPFSKLGAFENTEQPTESTDKERDAQTVLQKDSEDLRVKIADLTAALEDAQQKLKEMQTEKDQLQAVQKQFNERLIRVSAEFDNYRKRVARDQELMKKQAEERIVTGFLPVMDNLERALFHARQQNDYEQLLQGVEMTGKLYLAALAKYGCVPFGSLGETFDPVYHDVLQRVIDPEKPHNSIVQEHLKGYMMHERVLRPALVVVAQHEMEDNQGE